MKLDKIVQSLLLSLVIIGVFASMARNAYGFTFIGTACFGLALLYGAQLIWKLIDDFANLTKKDVPGLMEPFLLAALLLVFGFRASYIYLASGELIFLVVCGLLVLVYGWIGLNIFNQTKKEGPGLAHNIGHFYFSLLLFLLALASRNISLLWSSGFGALGMLGSLPFLWSVVRQQRYDISGKTVSFFQFIIVSKNKAGLLFLFFLSSALYTGLTYVSLIPEIANADQPKDYIELVRNAESGKEKPVNGKYQHQVYKEAMDKFLKRHGKK